MNFALFVLLNAVLMLRLEELFPAIAGLRLYLVVIALCTLVNWPGLADRLRVATWPANPLRPFLLLYLVLVTFSAVPRSGLGTIGDVGYQCFKNGLYVFLFLASVNTVHRFKALLGWFAALIVVVTTLSVLQYHGYTDIEALKPYREGITNDETEEFVGNVRLKGSGICSDPNDFCQILLLGSICCLARAALARGWLFSALWVLPTGLFAYGAVLTCSRGGLLGILAGIAGLVYIRFGRRIGGILIPFVLIGGVLAAGGRQANINVDANDTSQERVRLWAGALTLLSQNPLYILTGVGTGTITAEVGQVAHNSFIQAYVETGFVGGTLFACLIFVPMLALVRLRRPAIREPRAHEFGDLWRLRGHVFGMLTGFAVGCFSLTRNTNETSYVFLGFGACYLTLARDLCPKWFALEPQFLKRCAVFGIVVLVFVKVFTQVMQVH